MVARPGTIQLSMNSGEISPETRARTDVKNYYSGAEAMLNVEARPQGGFRLHPRTVAEALVGRTMDLAAAAVDGAPVASTTAGQVLVTVDVGMVRPLSGAEIDVTSAAASDGALRVEIEDAAGVWRQVSQPYAVVAGSMTRRRILLPPFQPLSGRRVRLVAVWAGLNISASRLTALYEIPTTIARLVPHTFSLDLAYDIVLTSGHADIYRAGVYVASVWHGIPFTTLPLAQTTQRLASLMIWHPDIAPHEIRRAGADHQWSGAVRAFANVPDVDYGGTYSSVAEQWTVYFTWDKDKIGLFGQSFSLSINGEDTGPIDIAAGGAGPSLVNWTLTNSRIQTALEGLASVEAGVAVALARDDNASASVTVTFGGSNSGEQYVVSAKSTSDTLNLAVTVGRRIRGKKGGEPVMSSQRGYPRTGIYFEDRLLAGGFRSRPAAWIGSRTGEYFDWNDQLETAASALLININTVLGAESILRFAQQRHLLIFTDAGLYYISSPALNRQQPPSIVRSPGPGISATVLPVESERGLIYVNREGSQVLAAQYSEVVQGYDPTPISLLASHLMTGLVYGSSRRAAADTDVDRFYLVRSDGVMVIGGLLRSQDVTGFTRWVTDGQVRDVSVNGARETRLLVERTIGGQQRLLLEKMTPDAFLDGAITVNQAASATVSGLGLHEGATVWAVADGWTEGPFTVAGGQITLPRPAASITVGRWTPPVFTSLPQVRELTQRQVLRRPARVHTLRATFNKVSSIAVGANGRPARNQPLGRDGDLAEGPWQPVAGEFVVRGLQGFSSTGQVTITQTVPGWLDVRDITIETRL